MHSPPTIPNRLPWTIALASAILIAAGVWFGIVSAGPSLDELKQEFQKAIVSKDWNKAEDLAARWTKRAPENGEAWLKQADLFLRQQKYQAAVDSLRQVPASSKESETALTTEMELQFGPLNRPADGAVCCEKLLIKNPRSSIAQQRLIFFLTMTLQRTRMIQQIRNAIELGTEPRESYIYLFFADSLSFANGAELNSHWLASDPESELYEVAEAIFTSESLDSSISMDDRASAETTRRAQVLKGSVMGRLLEKYPHNSELLAYNIRQRIQAGDQATVVSLLAQATIEAESDHRFWRFKGWVHSERNQPKEAESSFRRAIELHPMDWSTRHLLAELLQNQRRYDEVKSLREIVSRANELRRTLQAIPNARQISQDVMSRLADYARDCGDKQLFDELEQRFRQRRKP